MWCIKGKGKNLVSGAAGVKGQRGKCRLWPGSALECVRQNLIANLKESGGGAYGARDGTEAFTKDLHPLP